ncbi:hypothetical protein PT2222_160180 [Paraburkholderia tropica]
MALARRIVPAIRLKRLQPMETAAVEDQRRVGVEILAHAATLHFADEDHVVAFVVAAAVVAFEPGDGAVEHGHAGVAGRVRNAFEAVALHGGEALAQVELRRREHIHHIMAVAAEHRHRGRARGEAPEHERRRQRHRVERTRGDADQRAVGRLGRDDRDAGRELAERAAEGGGVEIGRAGAAGHRCAPSA